MDIPKNMEKFYGFIYKYLPTPDFCENNDPMHIKTHYIKYYTNFIYFLVIAASPYILIVSLKSRSSKTEW